MSGADDSYEEIRRLQAEVRKAHQDLELFASVLAHDLKEPLRARTLALPAISRIGIACPSRLLKLLAVLRLGVLA